MRHPPVEAIVLGDEEARVHVKSCAMCVRLATLAGVELPAQPAPIATFDKDRYVNWQELADGTGGMGRASRAWDRQIGREVVIKQPRVLAGAAGLDLRARFEREALLTARLSHPGIVAVYEAGTFGDGDPFYAMPLVRGRSLHDEIADRRTLEERLGLVAHVAAICDAVAYAHEQRVLHRDIKPANILVGTFGETVLIDWGLAKDFGAPAEHDGWEPAAPFDGLTKLGIGTPQYMPPEQAQAAALDERMDVYALGATLYHVLAGKPPYGDADNARARRDLLAGPPRPLDEIAPTVAPALIDIVARAMARDPRDRFPSARELADELRRFQTGQLVQSRRYTPAEIVSHFVRRHRVPVTIAAVAAALLAAVGVVSVMRVTRASHAAAEARQDAVSEEREASRAQRRSMGVSASELAFVPARRLDALALGVRAVAPALAAHEPAAPEAVQGLYDALRAGPALVPLDGASAAVTTLAFSPDGRWLVTGSAADHALELWDARTGTIASRLARGGASFMMAAVRCSPAGDQVLTWSRDPAQVQLWSTTGAPAITVDAGGEVAGADFLEDGTLAVAGRSLALFDRSGHELRRVDLPAPAAALAASGKALVVLGQDGDVGVWDGAGTRHLVMHSTAATTVAISPDATRIATAGPHGVDLFEAGQQRHVELAGDELAFSRSGRYLLVRRSGAATVIDVASGAAFPVTAHGVAAIDDTGVWTASPGRLALLDPETGAPLQVLEGPPGVSASAIGVAGDGRVAVATETATWVIAARDSSRLLGHVSEPTALGEVDSTVVSAGLDGRVRFWSNVAAEQSLGSEVLALATGPSGTLAGTADGRLIGFAPHTRERTTWLTAGAPIAALAMSPDGASYAAARTDGELVVGRDGHVLELARAGASPAAAIALSPDGRWLASGHLDGTVRLWDAMTGAAAGATPPATSREWNAHSMFVLAFAGSTLYAGHFGDDTHVFGVPALGTSRVLEGHLLAVSPDGRYAATAGQSEILVHELGAARAPHALIVHRPITAAAFSADGTQLALGDIDGALLVVDPSRESLAPALVIPAGSAGAVVALRFTSDRRSLVVAHAGGMLRVHPLALTDAMTQACGRLRSFGREEPSCR